VDLQIESEIERELSRAREHETRFKHLVRHSPLDFLTDLCNEFEDTRVIDAEAAQSCVYSHIGEFEKIQRDLSINEVGLVQFTGIWKELSEVRRIKRRVSEVIEYLIDIYEVALVEPTAVEQTLQRGRFLFQQQLM
jgi:hypothetical protein